MVTYADPGKTRCPFPRCTCSLFFVGRGDGTETWRCADGHDVVRQAPTYRTFPLAADRDREWKCDDCVRDLGIGEVKTLGRLDPQPCACGRGVAVNWIGRRSET